MEALNFFGRNKEKKRTLASSEAAMKVMDTALQYLTDVDLVLLREKGVDLQGIRAAMGLAHDFIKQDRFEEAATISIQIAVIIREKEIIIEKFVKEAKKRAELDRQIMEPIKHGI